MTPITMEPLADDASSPLPASHLSLTRALDEKSMRMRSVRLVCISDTHSFEQDLTSRERGIGKGEANRRRNADHTNSCSLPDGDVLIHGGDFVCDPRFDGRTVDQAQRSFDAWLATQPHKHKIVIAGNHDPPSAEWPCSGAIYAGGAPRSVEVEGVTLALVPYFREQFRKTKWVQGKPRVSVEKVRHKHFALPRGEVLVTHSPPHRVLDRCGSGEHGGSTYLRALVQRAAVKPKLWLCGHIHESRGAACVRFGGGGGTADERAAPTVVVNASNANAGIARRCEHGAIVIDL